MSKRIDKRRDELLGREFQTNICGKCFVIDYKGRNDVTVMFYEPLNTVKCQMGSLNKGEVRNPLSVVRKDRGFIGVGRYSPSCSKREYALWSTMLGRCYDEVKQKKFPTYKDVIVCEEWLDFQNFATWCNTQEYFNHKDESGRNYELDKDLMVKGNKIYSPDTCCFVPKRINSLMVSCNSRRGDYYIGVSYKSRDRKYASELNVGEGKRLYLGYYNTQQEAFSVYKEAKELLIKEVAVTWKGKIDDRVYNALINWKINIHD